jgi:GTPase-associated system helical domain
MANDGATTMHPDFPRWYREVGVDENRDRLQRRWTGVSTLVQGMTDEDVENALRVVFRAKSAPAADGLARIRQVFKDADDLFDMQGNDREMEVLCGASVAVLIERGDDLAASGALAVTTAALDGSRLAELPMNLPGLAEASIARIAESNRKRPDLQRGLSDFPKVSFAAAKEKLQQFDQNGVGAAFDAAGAAVAAGFDNIKKRLEAASDQTSRFIAIQDEELEMLWWVFGERSDDLNQPFKEVPAKAQALIFAKELAGATMFLPGPVSAKGLLSRAGLKESKKLTIPEAVNACEAQWLKSLAPPEEVSPLSLPIHFAIGRKLETNDDSSWIAGWAKSCGIDEKHSFPSLTLGNLFYRERLLSLFAKE